MNKIKSINLICVDNKVLVLFNEYNYLLFDCWQICLEFKLNEYKKYAKYISETVMINILNNNKISIDTINKIKESISNIKSFYIIKNPMKGITYDKSRNTYRIRARINDINEDHTFMNINDACNKLKIILENYYNLSMKKINVVTYKNYRNLFTSYKNISTNEELFDIRDVINITNKQPKQNQTKYNNFKNKIKNYYVVQNNKKGYDFIELVNIDVVKEIIVSCRIINKQLASLFSINIFDCAKISKEQHTLDVITKIFDGEEMQQQKVVGKYRIDLYFSKYKIAIECDEHCHKDRNKSCEKYREQYITDKLKCTFIRYNPDDKDFDINNVANKIHKTIMSLYN
jgi:very-short-patch-repair endonuclease